jgi:DNA-binding FadR family transcriptional regulator
MHVRRRRVTGTLEPDYQRLAALIRSRIASGEYPLDTPIPSTRDLVRDTKMSQPVVRRAIEQLKAEGILAGRQGKGVYVIATPADAAAERLDIKALGEQVAGLRGQVAELAERTETAPLATLAREVARIADAVGRIEVNLIDLYGKTGNDYPQGGSHDAAKATAGRGRPRR